MTGGHEGQLTVRADALTDAAVLALLAEHVAEMHVVSPPESVHALDLAGLRDPAVTVWSAWQDGELAGIAALKALTGGRGEVKSMRVVARFRGRGVGRVLVRHLVTVARTRGLTGLWLETGTEDHFAPARALYRSAGFVPCTAFDDYPVDDPSSCFMTLALPRTPPVSPP